jgi:hypothetical protein
VLDFQPNRMIITRYIAMHGSFWHKLDYLLN